MQKSSRVTRRKEYMAIVTLVAVTLTFMVLQVRLNREAESKNMAHVGLRFQLTYQINWEIAYKRRIKN